MATSDERKVSFSPDDQARAKAWAMSIHGSIGFATAAERSGTSQMPFYSMKNGTSRSMAWKTYWGISGAFPEFPIKIDSADEPLNVQGANSSMMPVQSSFLDDAEAVDGDDVEASDQDEPQDSDAAVDDSFPDDLFAAALANSDSGLGNAQELELPEPFQQNEDVPPQPAADSEEPEGRDASEPPLEEKGVETRNDETPTMSSPGGKPPWVRDREQAAKRRATQQGPLIETLNRKQKRILARFMRFRKIPLSKPKSGFVQMCAFVDSEISSAHTAPRELPHIPRLSEEQRRTVGRLMKALGTTDPDVGFLQLFPYVEARMDAKALD